MRAKLDQLSEIQSIFLEKDEIAKSYAVDISMISRLAAPGFRAPFEESAGAGV